MKGGEVYGTLLEGEVYGAFLVQYLGKWFLLFGKKWMVVAYIQGHCSSCISPKFAKWFVISSIWENDFYCLGKGELMLLFISKHVPIASVKKFASDLCKFFYVMNLWMVVFTIAWHSNQQVFCAKSKLWMGILKYSSSELCAFASLQLSLTSPPQPNVLTM